MTCWSILFTIAVYVYVCLCVHTHSKFFMDPKVKEKITFTHSQFDHFMLSTTRIFCVFTGESGSDILDLIRALHQSRGNVQVLLLHRNIKRSKLYSYGRFSGPERRFMYLKVFLEFSFVSFGNGLEFGPGGITGRQKSA